MISFGALRSPAFRIHTLAPVSFPLTTENHIPPQLQAMDWGVAVMDAF
ncbi:hypothetical protein [Rhodococcus sp. 24CO]